MRYYESRKDGYILVSNLHLFRNSLNSEQTRASDLRAVSASLAEVPGFAEINGSGEGVVNVNFAIKFTEVPYFKYGFSVTHGSEYLQGYMPEATAYVAEWTTIERLPFSVWYVGAKIHTKVRGLVQQKMILNFSFSGTALSNPSGEGS